MVKIGIYLGITTLVVALMLPKDIRLYLSGMALGFCVSTIIDEVFERFWN